MVEGAGEEEVKSRMAMGGWRRGPAAGAGTEGRSMVAAVCASGAVEPTVDEVLAPVSDDPRVYLGGGVVARFSSAASSWACGSASVFTLIAVEGTAGVG
jgi:hypothetical protein